MRRWLSLIVVAGHALLLTGCPSSGSDPPELVRAFCSTMAACNCATPLYADQGTCEKGQEKLYRDATDAAQDVGSAHDDACAAAVSVEIEEAGCASAAELQEQGASLPVCKIYSGTSQLGESCQDFGFFHLMSDCAVDLWCYDEQCRAWDWRPAPAGLGEYCYKLGDSTPAKPCDEGLACDVEVGTCIEGAGNGEPCDEDLCGLPFWCDTNADSGSTCVPRIPVGGSCSHPEDVCESKQCVDTICASPDAAVCDLTIVF